MNDGHTGCLTGLAQCLDCLSVDGLGQLRLLLGTVHSRVGGRVDHMSGLVSEDGSAQLLGEGRWVSKVCGPSGEPNHRCGGKACSRCSPEGIPCRSRRVAAMQGR